MMARVWASVANVLESLLLAGERRWHADTTLSFPGKQEPTVELLDPGRPWFRCCACGRAWSLELGLLGRMPKDWFLCPAGCNVPRPDLKVVAGENED